MSSYPSYTPPPPPAYGQQPYPGPVGPQTNTLAIISLITGIIGFSLIAIITGHIAKKQFKENPDKYSGEGMATAGLILGYIWLALILIPVCFITVMALLGPGIGSVFSNITETIYYLHMFAV